MKQRIKLVLLTGVVFSFATTVKFPARWLAKTLSLEYIARCGVPDHATFRLNGFIWKVFVWLLFSIVKTFMPSGSRIVKKNCRGS